MNSGVYVRVAVSLGPFDAPLPCRLFRTGSRALPVSRRSSPAGPLLPRPDLPCGLISRCAGPGRRTKKGHGERRRQVSTELLAPGPRAGRAGPGVLPLSAGGLCVCVPRPHHSPLGPGQVSAASPAAPPSPNSPAVLQASYCVWEEDDFPALSCSLPLFPAFPLLCAPSQLRALALWVRSVRL